MKTAEKIYSASVNEDAFPPPLAERLARQMEDDLALSNVPAGKVMGSLRELSEHYEVGRAAAREALALLERRGLGRLRPGPCGGFIVGHPDAEAIGLELANSFRIAGVTSAHLLDARDAVDGMAAFLAASTNSPVEIPAPVKGSDALAWHCEARSALAEASGEPVLPLFVKCLNELTGEFAAKEAANVEWLANAKVHERGLELAIANGDAEAAMAQADALNGDLVPLMLQDGEPLPLPVIEAVRHEDDRTLAALVARKLAAQILHDGRPGQRLGSEWDLCERFSVSRATLRQAIRQLQDAGLVECRRGRGNGLVVRSLHATGGIRLVLAFVISRQMDPQSAGTILFQLNRFVPALAVARASRSQRAELRKLLARADRNDSIDRYELLRLVQFVSRLSDSPIVDLFSRCVAAYEARFHPFLIERLPATMHREYFDLLRRLLDRLDGRDPDQLIWAKQESARVMLGMSRERPI
jgi:DNA-binding FadR family transcriptional regulator